MAVRPPLELFSAVAPRSDNAVPRPPASKPTRHPPPTLSPRRRPWPSPFLPVPPCNSPGLSVLTPLQSPSPIAPAAACTVVPAPSVPQPGPRSVGLVENLPLPLPLSAYEATLVSLTATLRPLTFPPTVRTPPGHAPGPGRKPHRRSSVRRPYPNPVGMRALTFTLGYLFYWAVSYPLSFDATLPQRLPPALCVTPSTNRPPSPVLPPAPFVFCSPPVTQTHVHAPHHPTRCLSHPPWLPTGR